MGVANERSIAWGISQKLAEAGAELAFTYLGDALKKRVIPLAEKLNSKVTFSCDVEKKDEVVKLFDDMKSQPKNNKKLVLGLVKEFDKVFSQHKTHQSFLDETGISVRDGKRAISFGTGSFVWQLQDGKCKKCGTRISVRDDKDHKLEYAEGGKGDKDPNNVQLLCNSCHKEKTKNFVSNTDDED